MCFLSPHWIFTDEHINKRSPVYNKCSKESKWGVISGPGRDGVVMGAN